MIIIKHHFFNKMFFCIVTSISKIVWLYQIRIIRFYLKTVRNNFLFKYWFGIWIVRIWLFCTYWNVFKIKICIKYNWNFRTKMMFFFNLKMLFSSVGKLTLQNLWLIHFSLWFRNALSVLNVFIQFLQMCMFGCT